MITFDDNLSGGQTFFCVLGNVEGQIWQQKGSNPQNLFLLVSPMCQDTPCTFLWLYDHLCRCSALIFTITSFRQNLFPKRVFFGPWDQTGPSWGWSLPTCDGPRYKTIRNNSEKKVAKNILRSGPGSRPIWTVFSPECILQAHVPCAERPQGGPELPGWCHSLWQGPARTWLQPPGCAGGT